MSSATDPTSSDVVVNDATVEHAWATMAFEHALTYESVLKALTPSQMKFSSHDADMYTCFRTHFPTMALSPLNLAELNQTVVAKDKWRAFIDEWKDKIEDYNVGSLLRLKSDTGLDEENCVLATRVQWMAIEVARCREGKNDEFVKNSKST